MVALLPRQPNVIHELLALTRTLTLFGYISYAFLAPFIPEVKRMKDTLQLYQCLLFYICFHLYVH